MFVVFVSASLFFFVSVLMVVVCILVLQPQMIGKIQPQPKRVTLCCILYRETARWFSKGSLLFMLHHVASSHILTNRTSTIVFKYPHVLLLDACWYEIQRHGSKNWAHAKTRSGGFFLPHIIYFDLLVSFGNDLWFLHFLWMIERNGAGFEAYFIKRFSSAQCEMGKKKEKRKRSYKRK